MAMIDKRRVRPNEIESMRLMGDVEGKTALIIDDIIDTGNTLAKAGELLKEKGATKVIAYATHGVMSNKAREILLTKSSPFDKILITNTIPFEIKPEFENRIEILDVSDVFAKVIKRVDSNTSISSLFL